MAKRIKKNASTSCSIEQAQEASKTVAEKSNKLEKIEAKMNEELNKVKTRYSDEITEINEELVEPKAMLEVFANEQRGSWGEKKSFELVHTILGFRTGNPKVNKQKQFTWDAVLDLLKKNKKFKQFIRVKEEINKEAILLLNASEKKDKLLLKQLNDKCYLFIDQTETFFITPKKEEVV
jgi:phage host-nuclease inhibitor protein Gam